MQGPKLYNNYIRGCIVRSLRCKICEVQNCRTLHSEYLGYMPKYNSHHKTQELLDAEVSAEYRKHQKLWDQTGKQHGT